MTSPALRRLVLGSLLAVIVAFTSQVVLIPSARSQVPVTASISDVDDSGEAVRGVLTVDQGGRPVPGLTADAISIVDSGRSALVTSFEPAVDEAIPLALVLVIDTSGSMAPQIGDVQRAALDLVAQLGPDDTASVVAFASEVAAPEALTSNASVLTATIDGLEAAGDTALYDAVVAAADVARDAGFQRRAVVLLTDGEDFGGVSATGREASLEAAMGAAAFYTIGVGPSVDSEYLGALAADTGGRFFPASTGTEIAEVYATIEALLRSQYLLEFERGEAVGGEERSLVVTVDVDGLSVVATTDYVSLAPLAVPLAPPVAAATAVSAPAVVATPVEPVLAVREPDGGSSLVRPLLLLVLAAGLAAGGVLLLRRRGQSELAPASISAVPRLDARPIARPRDARPAATTGQLTLVDGDRPTFVELGVAPITVGTAAACDFALPPSPEAAPAHARIWTRDGRVMVHHVADGFETLVNGRPIEWAVLNDGDELRVGPHTITYRSASPQPVLASTGGG